MTPITPDITNESFEHWEDVLMSHGLGKKQLGLEDDQEQSSLPVEISSGRRVTLYNRDFEYLLTQLDSRDLFMNSGHQIRKLRVRRDETPAWANSDIEVRKLIRRVFPKWGVDPRQRTRAARWVRIIYLFYRVGMSRPMTAAEIKATPKTVARILGRIRKNVRRTQTGS